MPSGLLDKINMNQLRVFTSVYRNRSMTLAAQELFLTQSGVSQHIKILEDLFGFPLFIRNRGELFPVSEADTLYQTCETSFIEINSVMEKLISGLQMKVEGIVRLGVPTDFGNNVVIPILGSWCKQYPDVQIDFIYGYGNEMQSQLENGNVDLAFIDSLRSSPRIDSQVVYSETLSLVASTEYVENKGMLPKTERERINYFHNLEFLEYQHHEPVLRMWFRHQYGKKNIPLRIRAWAQSVQGIAHFVKQGIGAAVLPDHVIESLKEDGSQLHLFKGPKGSLKNDISLAWVKKKPLRPAAEDLKKFIITSRKRIF